MQMIKKWLEGKQNFKVGAIIYKTLGKKQSVKDLLAKGENDFNKKLLVEEFKRMLEPAPAAAPAPVAAPIVEKDNGEVMPESFDEILQSIKQKWAPAYQQMNYLRHRLDKAFEDENSIEAINYRKDLAFAILSLEQKCMQTWKERDYYLRHGKLPNVPDTKTFVVPTDPVELAGLISNIAKNIRRNRKNLRDNPGDAKYAQLLADYRAKYKHITAKDYEEKDLPDASNNTRMPDRV